MTLFSLFLTGIVSGFIDAIAGGGGLIMLPGLILSGLPVPVAIATNKLCGTFGVLTSSLKFAKEKNVDWRACTYMGLPTALGAFVGSRSIGLLPKSWAEPIVIMMMIAITAVICLKPKFGMKEEAKDSGVDQFNGIKILKLTFFGFIIGFHDGFFGPGIGTFLVFVLISVCSLDFLRGTGSAKVINLVSNFTALLSFLWFGTIDFSKGFAGAFGVIIGAYIGATFAGKIGVKLIKPLFLTVTFILTVKLLLNYLAS